MIHYEREKKSFNYILLCFMIIIAGLFACTRSAKEIIPSSEYAPYVNAYTGGVISQSSPIRIELTQDQPTGGLKQSTEG